MVDPNAAEFWADVFPREARAWRFMWTIMRRSLVFAAIAAAIYLFDVMIKGTIFIEITPYEIIGAAISVMLVLRTNVGYDRWWEGRRLWGGIVNQSRNLTVAALEYGPANVEWRAKIVRWTIVFAHATRRRLRHETKVPEAERLLGAADAMALSDTRNAPLEASARIAALLDAAPSTPAWALMQMERERMSLVDYLGGCERILKTPLSKPYAMSLRQFLFGFLIATPLALGEKAGWFTPLVTLLVAYPLLALDHIAEVMQDPFHSGGLWSLHLDDICRGLEQELLALVVHDEKLAPRSEAERFPE